MSIGLALREAREEANLSIEEAAWRTRIKPEYLRALENDEHEALGEAAFVRGPLSSYARFLGLKPDPLLVFYEREYEPPSSPIEHLDRQVRVARRPPRPRWLLAAIMAAAALIGVSAVGLVHGPGSKPSARAALPTLPPRLDQPQTASRGVAERPAAAPIVLEVAADARAWVEIVADGRTVFSGIIAQGTQQVFRAERTLKVSLGNAGATRLIFNGAAVPLRATGVWSGTFAPTGLQA